MIHGSPLLPCAPAVHDGFARPVQLALPDAVAGCRVHPPRGGRLSPGRGCALGGQQHEGDPAAKAAEALVAANVSMRGLLWAAVCLEQRAAISNVMQQPYALPFGTAGWAPPHAGHSQCIAFTPGQQTTQCIVGFEHASPQLEPCSQRHQCSTAPSRVNDPQCSKQCLLMGAPCSAAGFCAEIVPQANWPALTAPGSTAVVLTAPGQSSRTRSSVRPSTGEWSPQILRLKGATPRSWPPSSLWERRAVLRANLSQWPVCTTQLRQFIPPHSTCKHHPVQPPDPRTRTSPQQKHRPFSTPVSTILSSQPPHEGWPPCPATPFSLISANLAAEAHSCAHSREHHPIQLPPIHRVLSLLSICPLLKLHIGKATGQTHTAING